MNILRHLPFYLNSVQSIWNACLIYFVKWAKENGKIRNKTFASLLCWIKSLVKWKINRLRIWHYFSTVVIVEWYKEYRIKKRKCLHVSLTWLANAIKTRCIPNAFWNKNDEIVVAIFLFTKTRHFFHYMPPALGNHSIVLNKHTKPSNECVPKLCVSSVEISARRIF